MTAQSEGKLKLPSDAEARIDNLQSRYPTKAATLLPVLWEIQNHLGWLPPDWMEYAAARCEVPVSKVLGVVSFYTMFHQKEPGRHHVQVCRNISCTMLGAEDILLCVRSKLGITNGGRTEDGRFSFEEVECLAGCSFGPVVQINRTYHEHMTPEKTEKLLDSLK